MQKFNTLIRNIFFLKKKREKKEKEKREQMLPKRLAALGGVERGAQTSVGGSGGMMGDKPDADDSLKGR